MTVRVRPSARAEPACARESAARPLEVGGSIDTERNSVNDRHVDAHAVLERPQLLELLAQLERRRPQRDEALQRRPAVGVDADVMVERPIAARERSRG